MDLFVSLFLPTHNWHTIGPIIVVLVLDDSCCSNKQISLFLDSVKQKTASKLTKLDKMVRIAKMISIDDPYHNK